jgi:hypothetical protein
MKVTNAGLQNDAETQDVSFETIFNGTAKAWSNLNGTGTIAERDSFNMSGYVDNGTGDYTSTIAADMSDANYGAVNTGGDGSTGIRACGAQAYAAGSFRTYARDLTNSANDPAYYNLAVLGDLA